MKEPMEILSLFPVRKSKKQKTQFLDTVQDYLRNLGYSVSLENSDFGVRNVVVGNLQTAKYVVTAHYDTCAGLLIPNLITPCNFFLFLLWQLMLVMLFALEAMFIGVVVGVIAQDPAIGVTAVSFSYWILLFLLLFGPANRHNANDNTSGVVTVLEIARSLPENQRHKVCFVLFDLEEAGLLGSAAFRKMHKKETNEKIILNLDCVGDGDEIVFFPTRKMKKNLTMMQELDNICRPCGKKSIRLKAKGFSIYPSDQSNFPYGVGIAAFRRKKGVGLYCSRIHTSRDTILDQTNVNILRSAITTLICQ